MSRHYWGRTSWDDNDLEAERDFFVCSDHTYGHPSIIQPPRDLSEGAIERARAMMTFGPRDHRFANLVNIFSRMMR